MKKEIKQKDVYGKEPFNRRRVVFGVALILAAVIIGVILIPKLAKKNKIYNVILTARSVETGTVITRDNVGTLLKTYQTTDKDLAETGFQSANDLYGKFIARDLNQNSIVKKTDVVASMNLSTDKVPEGKELVGVAVGAIQTDIGFMPRAGDIIRIYGLKNDGTVHVNEKNGRLEPGVSSEAFEYELLQYVKVYSALDGNGVSIVESGASPTNMVLVCSNSQVKQLIEAQNVGHVYMTLISSGDANEAKKLLTLQDRIVEEYDLRNSLIDTIEKQPVAMPIEMFTRGKYAPLPGDYIRISYVGDVEYSEFNEKGELVTKTKVDLINNELLRYIKVSDVIDEKGVSISLAEENTDPRLRYPNKTEGYKISLELADEQVKLIQELYANNQLFITFINESDEKIEAGLDEVDGAIRYAKMSALRAEIEELERQEAEAEAARAEELRKAEEEAKKNEESSKAEESKEAKK